MTITVGSRLGSHDIVGLLGAGGMGEVFLAYDSKLKRHVAIKLLPEAYARDPERLARFHREAQAVAAINHPNIATVYDFEESGGVTYLVLELVEGDTLADRLRQGPFPVNDAQSIAIQILKALGAAHDKGICHRDLKPSNIKLTAHDVIKVLDFGIAKLLRPTGDAATGTTIEQTTPGVVIGSAGYMSPEQAKGLETDQRSDIFSFGCVFYELLTGHRAFDGDTTSEIQAGILKSPVDFSRLPASLHPRLREILMRCLEKNPRERWHAAADVWLQIEAISDAGSPGQVPGSDPRQASWKRAAAIALATVVVALMAGVGGWSLKPAPSSAVTRFSIPLPEGQQFSHVGRLVLAVSPDGTNLVYVANRRLHLRPLAGFESSVIPGSELADGVQSPVFSPDGQSIAFRSVGDGLLKRIPVSGGTPVTIGPNPSPFGVSWNDDGLLFGQYGTGILRVAAEGGEPEVIIQVPEDETADGPQLLPGGNVLYSVKKVKDDWDQGQIAVQSIAGGPRKVVVNGGAAAVYVPTGHLVYAVGNVLFAVAFDVKRLAVTGGAVSVLEGVNRGGSGPRGAATAQFVISNTGSLAFVPGTRGVARGRLVDLALFDRTSPAKPLGLRPARYGAPRVSPDGKWAAVEQESETGVDIWLVDLTGTGPIRRLTFGGKNRAPIWLGDSWVVFQSDDSSGPGLFRQRADGSGTAERLTSAAAGVVHVPQSASPDGTHVLVTIVEGGRQSLWALSLKDRGLVPFGGVQSPVTLHAAFSPDGRWVAYSTGSAPQGNQDWRTAAFVQPFPATGATFQIPGAIGGATRPVWSRSGDAILVGAGIGRDAAIPVVTAPRFEFGNPEVFPLGARLDSLPDTRRNFDPVADGRLLGLMPSASDPAAANPEPRIAVVLNWFDELRAKVR